MLSFQTPPAADPELRRSHQSTGDCWKHLQIDAGTFLFFVYRIPENNLPYLHKRPQIRMLLLSALCIGVSVVWMVFRNEDQ